VNVYVYVADDNGPSFNPFDVIGPKAAEFNEITLNNGYYTVQGHSRSPFATFWVRITVTYFISCTVSKISRFAFDRGGGGACV